MKAPPTDEAPGPKRQRTTRTSTSGKTMKYDMNYHPMDDVLRPAASAARKAAHGINTRQDPTTSESRTYVEESDESDCESYVSSLGTLGATGTLGTPPRRPILPRAGSPSSRRVTRAELNGEKPVMYNMRHHPADVVLRPAAARRVIDEWSKGSDRTSPPIVAGRSKTPSKAKAKHTDSKITEEAPATPLSPVSSEEPIPTSSSPDTPAALPQAQIEDLLLVMYPGGSLTDEVSKLGWKSLSESDRLLYLLQQGAYDNSEMLPLSWMDAALSLRKRFGLGDFPSTEQATNEVDALRARYRSVSQHMQDFFGAELEPATKEDETFYYAEDFDVYDLEPGDKYFKRRSDCIVMASLMPTMDEKAFGQKSDLNQTKPIEVATPCPQCILDRLGNTLRSTSNGLQARCSHDVDRQGKGNHGKEENQVMNPDEQPCGDASQDLEGDDMQHLHTADDENVNEEGQGRGLFGSYNDAEGYIRQSMGPHDEYSSTQESPERELIASMRNSISANIDDVLDLDDLTPMLSSLPEPIMQASGRRDKPRQRSTSRRNKRSTGGSDFSVHEDAPGGTPKIKKHVAMNRKSPGTDIPKENLQERSPSEEIPS